MKWLSYSLLILGVGTAACAGPLSGSADICAQFDDTGLTLFGTVIDLDYSISGIEFGVTAIFDLGTFDNLFFTALGSIGAFDFRSMIDFEPQTSAFMAWTNAAKVSIGGADLFAIVALRNVWPGTPQTPSYGIGAHVGLDATIGDVRVTAVSSFNMIAGNSVAHFVHDLDYGYDYVVSHDAYQWCGEWYKPGPNNPYYLVRDGNCDLCWSQASIYITFPFACLEVTAGTFFDCRGFGFLDLMTDEIELLPWLALEYFSVSFDVASKYLNWGWDIVLGDLLCATPYFSLEGDHGIAPWTIEGITLNALLLEYSYNGVTVKAGEIFDNTWYEGYLSITTVPWGFTLSGDLSQDHPFFDDDCVYDFDYDEFFGIWIDGDSCCGGAFNIGLISFFDTSDTGNLFDWQETVATMGFGVGTNVSITLQTSLMIDGLNWFKICGGFSF